jgi:hypothetical protein
MIVILMSGDAKDLSFDAQALATVAELGITSLALLRDDDTLALVADGWAFDAAKSQQSNRRAHAGREPTGANTPLGGPRGTRGSGARI